MVTRNRWRGERIQSLSDRIRPARDIRSLVFRNRITFRREANSHIVKPDFGPTQVDTHDIGWGLNAGLWPAFL